MMSVMFGISDFAPSGLRRIMFYNKGLCPLLGYHSPSGLFYVGRIKLLITTLVIGLQN